MNTYKTYEMGHDVGNAKEIENCLADMKEHLRLLGYVCDIDGHNFTTDCPYAEITESLRLVRLDCEKFYITLV